MNNLLLLAVVCLPALAAQARPAEMIQSDDPAGAFSTEVVPLQELWRVGGDDTDLFFGRIGGLLVDPDGRVYVADTQAQEISVFSSEGVFLRHLGHEGEGPGEFQNPRSMLVMPDGTIGVLHEQPPRIICYRASDGEFLRDFHLAEDASHPFQRVVRVECRGETLVAYASDLSESPDGMKVTGRVMCFGASGRFLGQCDSLTSEFSYARPVVRERLDLLWTIGPEGRVYICRDQDYSVAMYGRDCVLERHFTRDFERVRRTTAELDSIRAYYRRVGNADVELLDYKRDISGMWVDGTGRLWVMSSRGRENLAADSLAVFDVFDRKGNLDRSVEMKAERGANDWYHMDRNRLFVVHRETMELVVYQMPELRR